MSVIDFYNEYVQSETSELVIKTVGTILVIGVFGKSIKFIISKIKSYRINSKLKADVDEKKLRLCQKLKSMQLPFDNIHEICNKLSGQDIIKRISDRTLKVIDVFEAFQAHSLVQDSECNGELICDIVYDADVEAIMLDSQIDDDKAGIKRKFILGWPIAITEDLKASENYEAFKSSIKKFGGIILFITNRGNGSVVAVKSKSAVASFCIDSCDDMFKNQESMRRCYNNGLCSFRPTISSHPVSAEGCLSLIGSNVDDLIALNKSLCFHGNDIDAESDDSTISIGYWMSSETKDNENMRKFLLDKLVGHELVKLDVTKPTHQEIRSLDSAHGILEKAHQCCGNPSFVNVKSAMATIGNYRAKILREMKERYKIDVVICIGCYGGHNLENVASLFTIATGVDVYSNNNNGTPMGVVSCDATNKFVCLATSSWEDEKCLKVMKMIG